LRCPLHKIEYLEKYSGVKNIVEDYFLMLLHRQTPVQRDSTGPHFTADKCRPVSPAP
jgi:hypothetical protein